LIRRALGVLLAALALSACGGESGGPGGADGTAELWITHDRGAEVVLTATVPAGQTVLQALKAEADVETRYGGRFVQDVNGVEGSLAGQRDWFYFLNGIEPDVGAAEVTLRPGDIAWWDFRSWKGEARAEPVVVGAFPEPFLHGWGGERRRLEVRAPPFLAPEADALRKLLGGEEANPSDEEPNVFLLRIEPGTGATLTAAREAGNDSPVTFTLAGSLQAVRFAALNLAASPRIVRFRYTARFDGNGEVLG